MIAFGTGGWRAVIGDDFIRSNIELLAASVAELMQWEKKTDKGIIIGYDRRFLSKETMQWCGQVFAGYGITAYLVNKAAPTPLVMYYCMVHGMPYGMMVTASHNPAIYNGIKVFMEDGRDADVEVTGKLESIAVGIEKEGKSIPKMDYEEAKEKGLIQEIYPLNEYLDAVLEKLDTQAIRNARLKVAMDPMYGVSEIPLKTLLMTTRCDVESIHDTHDTLFGGKMPAPNEETLLPLQTKVMEYGFDIGIATDGDADRLGVIDDKGRYLTPNDILVLLYYYFVKYRGLHGPVVRNVATTHLLDRIAAEFGEKCYEVPVGFKYISSKMTEVDALIGGESSGGLTVRGHINGKDGIYAAMLLIEMMAVTGRKISEIYEEIEGKLGPIIMEERAFRFAPEKKTEMNRLLMEEKALPDLPWDIDRVSYLDGVKVYFRNGGWVIARFSGTEPLIRVFSEMPTREAAVDVCARFETFLGL